MSEQLYSNAAQIIFLKTQYFLTLNKSEYVQESLDEYYKLLPHLVNSRKTNSLKRQMVMIEILFLLHMGNSFKINELINQLHDSLTVPDYSTPTPIVDFENTTNPYLMAYLISGIANKSKDNSRAKIFFNEGLKAIKRESIRELKNATIKEALVYKNTLNNIKSYLYLHLVETLLTRCELISAFHVLEECTKFITTRHKNDMNFEFRLLYDWALLLQNIGDTENAATLYTKLSKNPEFSWLSNLNLHLINLQKDSNLEKLHDMEKGNLKHESMMNLLKGYKTALDGEFKSTK